MEQNLALATHRQKIDAIAAAVKEFAQNARPGDYFSLKKASVSHMAPQPDNPRYSDKKIDVKALTEIISIDLEKRICVAESGVTFVRLVEQTLKHGLVPACVSELKEITIGGAVAGCSVESMSFKHGGFFDSCIELEIVAGTGEVVTCSKSKAPEVFDGIHGSFGTLGILTLLTFKLLPARPFVEVKYVKYASFEALLAAIREHYEKQDIEMMDALVHGPDKCILCIGTFVDYAPKASKYFAEPYYKSTLELDHDYMHTSDYFFRYDADCHWSIRNYPGLENRIVRQLFGNFLLGSSNILHLTERLPFLVRKGNKPDVIVDVFIPFKHAQEFFDWCKETFDYYPLWIVPYRMQPFYPWLNPALIEGITEPLFIDFAIYGFQQKGDKNYYKILEEKVFELQGMKTLITHNYYDEASFWKSFNKPFYDLIKARIDPKNLFRNLYAKTNYKKHQGS
nr:FAD-binding oxidoreductase [Candidatus Sigynarchaeota archaeon]